MKKNLLCTQVIACGGALALTFSGCAGGRQYTDNGQIHYKRSTGEYIDDKSISGKVKKELVSDKTVRARDVNVESYQGIVQLSGFVDTAEQKDLAEKIARGVPGVKDVQNSILMKPAADQSRADGADLTPTGKPIANQSTTLDDRSIQQSRDRVTAANTSVKASGTAWNESMPRKASALMGTAVENSQEQKLGDVKDLAIDLSSGKVAYVVVSSGGVLGIGQKNHVVPGAAFAFDPTDKNLRLNVSKERWKESPIFNDKNPSFFSEAERNSELLAFYEVRQDALTRSENRLSGVGKEDSDNVYRKGSRVQMASQLIGKRVINRQQDRIGHVADLLVDLDGDRGTLAIVETDEYLGDRDGRFLVPSASFGLAEGTRNVVLDINRKMLEDAQEFRSDNWPTGGSGEVFRYQAVNGSVKRTDTIRSTTSQQEFTDTDIAAKIRKEVLAGNSFSTTAKNVQVIARDGKVTLRGYVMSQSEEDAIVDIAQRIAGKTNVDSEMAVRP